MRSEDSFGLVHQSPNVTCKVDVGVTLPNGRGEWLGYIGVLKSTRLAYFYDLANYSGADKLVPKDSPNK